MSASSKLPVNHGFGAAVVLLSFLLALPACSAPSSQRLVVKWYAGLDLGDFRGQSIAAWREALSQPWRLGGEPVTFMVGNGGNRTMVDRCDKLFPAVDAGLRADGTDQAIFEGWVVGCEAVRWLVNAAIPQSDSMGHFPLDEKHVCSLPAGMGLAISRESGRQAAAIEAAGGSLCDYTGRVELQTVDKTWDRQVVVHGEGGESQLLSILAEGDFDHDGANDLLISSFNSVSGGSYRSAHLYIVSRRKADGPLMLRGGK